MPGVVMRTAFRATLALSFLATIILVVVHLQLLPTVPRAVKLSKPGVLSAFFHGQDNHNVTQKVSEAVAWGTTVTQNQGATPSLNSTLTSSTIVSSAQPMHTESHESVPDLPDRIVIMGSTKDEDTSWVSKLIE